MSLQIYCPQDIANALLAAEQANSAAFEAVAVTDEATVAFRRGYRAALTTLALAFGLIPQRELQSLESLEWEEKLSFSRPQLHNRKR